MNVRENLKAYLDGELSPDDMQTVARAIESDAELREEVQYMRALGFEIKRVASEISPVGVDRVTAAVRNKRRWSLPRTPIGRFALAGGALAGIVILVALVGPSFRQARGGLYAESVAYRPAAGADHTQAPASEEPARSEANSEIAGAKAESRSQDGFAANAPTTDAGPNMSVVQPERMVVRNGTIAVRVGGGDSSQTDSIEKSKPLRAVLIETVSEAVEQSTQLARSFGGYIESASYSGMQGRLPTANVVIRVASKHFDSAMQQLRGMGVVLSESMSGEDVTAQYSDVEGRLKVLRAEADSYVTMLRAARKVGEIMEIKDRLSQVRQAIESYESQRRSLKNLSSLSTINATFQQRVAVGKPAGDEDWSGSAWAKAVNGLVSAGQALGRAAIYVFVYSPIWLPIVIVVWLLVRSSKQRS